MKPGSLSRTTLCDQDLHRLSHVLADNERLLHQVMRKHQLAISKVNLIEEPPEVMDLPTIRFGSKGRGKEQNPPRATPPKRYGGIGPIHLSNKRAVRKPFNKRYSAIDLLSLHRSPSRVLPKRYGNLLRAQQPGKRSLKAPGQGVSRGFSQQRGRTSQVAQINSLVHQSCRNPKDTTSTKAAIQLISEYPKENLAVCLFETLKKLRPEKREEILEILEESLDYVHTNLRVEIFKRPRDQKTKDQYQYYVRFNHVQSKQQTEGIRFRNHAAAAIYALHLVDRALRKDNCTPIDVTQNMEALQEIYSKMFNTDKPISGIRPMTRLKDDNKYIKEKKRLTSYYNEINKVVQDNVSGLDFVWPYCCYPNSFIRLNPESIIIPEELIPEVWKNR